ncbi:hypothetical protein C8Q76DRAFT_445326 [Earliella scabrosa]|nr:hypothetical protein C8Q76DRAFT_445326 [Earliella scabrosa]
MLPRDDEPNDAGTLNEMYQGLGADAAGIVNASFTLTTIGQLALLLLGATILLSHGVHRRSAVLANLLVVTFLSSIPPYLLLYGAVMWDSNPPTGLCVTQAALMDGAGTMVSIASLAMVIDIMVAIRIVVPSASMANSMQILLITTPYIVVLIFSISALALGLLHPDEIKRTPNTLACSLKNTTFAIAIQIVIVLTLTTALCLEAYAILDALRARYQLTDLRRPSLLTTSQAVRIVLFTVLQAFFLLTSALDTYVPSPGLHIASIFYRALMPLATSVIFGLTEDCLSTWKKCVTFAKCRRTDRAKESAIPFTFEIIVTRTVEKKHEYARAEPIRIPLPPLTV